MMSQGRSLAVDVRGMDCQGCVNSVNKAIKSVKGVIRTEVTLEKKRAIVWFESKDPSDLQEKVRKAITKAGYLVGDAYLL